MTARERDIARIKKVLPRLDGDDHPQVAYILGQLEGEPEKIDGEDDTEASKRQTDRMTMLTSRAFDIIKHYERTEVAA